MPAGRISKSVGPPTAEVISTGDELTLGRVVNSNAAWLSRRLSAMGFEVVRHVTLPDVMGPVVAEYRAAFRRADLVILSGGLGPTVDDLTREAVARATARPLVRDAAALERIRSFFARRNRPMPANNERQADIPRGATIVPNPVGTAPGFALRHARALAVALPGVPAELFSMFDATVALLLEKSFPRRPAVAVKELEIIGLAESEIDRRLRDVATPDGNPRLSLMVRDGTVCVRLLARGRTAAEARTRLAPAVRHARRLFGDRLFGEDGADIAEVVARILLKRKLTLAVAESCTGGLIGHLLTNIPGISDALLEDVVTYSNDSKMKRLGVPRAILRAHGAVSAETAAAMAEGLARTSGARATLSVTGIAGPGGGTAAKPVGLVYSAVRFAGKTTVLEHRFAGDRAAIKARAARIALDHLRKRVIGLGG